MPKFAPISIEDLKAKIEGICYDPEESQYYDIEKLTEVVESDRIHPIDFENFHYDPADDCGPKNLMGYKQTEYGLTYLGCWGGCDWHVPAFFIIYWDGEKLKAYFPEDGNPWNTLTNELYGDNYEKDMESLKERYPKVYEDSDTEEARHWEQIETDGLECNSFLIKKDMEKHFA